MELGTRLSTLLLVAWMLPLASFVVIVLFGPRLGKAGRSAGYIAAGAILGSFVLSFYALVEWIRAHGLDLKPSFIEPYHGDWYTLCEFGSLRLTIGYYIDALTIVMFTMVTLVATCIHFYAWGYMHEELDDVTDHEVTLANGEHLHRPGRYHRFFQYKSLFCFSMLGLVIAGNIAMTFVFWELVGICSYFLIGFYIERKSASNAANKAFIVNRVGDFGMIIGLMALLATLGTFDFGGDNGIFAQVRPATDNKETSHQLVVPDGMVTASAADEVATVVREHPHSLNDAKSQIESRIDDWRKQGYGYGLLIVAGLGIFCGCVGKSAQFPLHTWLPDAMEGPTPVSALVHSATMVAAGVFLVGRFYPVFTPEVLLVISVIGCITLFMAATIAITATDIKRVLAYSTLSQLGYMMFALGIGGWVAGMLHLITHAFFKSLLFLCSGSVIHAVHSNEMTDMGGLLKKMPITGYTMLVGCLAIIGAGVPTIVGLSGYYSKDAIIAQALHYSNHNAVWGVMFVIAAGGAAITAFYMFRLWFMTFLGEPRDQHRFEHAHESPNVMWIPLVVLSFFAIFAAIPDVRDFLNPASSPLVRLLEQARPPGTGIGAEGVMATVTIPAEHGSHAHDIHRKAGMIAFGTALGGFLLACSVYWWRLIDPEEVRTMFAPIHRFLYHKWWFDELFDLIFVRPTLFVSKLISGFDRYAIDWLIDNSARAACWFSGNFDRWIDQTFVDGFVNWFARRTYAVAMAARHVQTGRIRQYVVFIVVGTVALFLMATFGISK